MAKKKNKGDESRIEMGRGMICRRTLSSLMTRLPLTTNAHAQLRAKPPPRTRNAKYAAKRPLTLLHWVQVGDC